jgi:hypothetical protein
VLDRAARNGATVLPAHYPGHGGATVAADGDGYRIDGWAGFAPL